MVVPVLVALGSSRPLSARKLFLGYDLDSHLQYFIHFPTWSGLKSQSQENGIQTSEALWTMEEVTDDAYAYYVITWCISEIVEA